MENKDLVALTDLVNEYQEKEKSLSSLSSELELQSRQFATYIEQQKRQADELKLLKQEIKDYMTEHNIMQHDTGLVELKLSSTGKYSHIEDCDEDFLKQVWVPDNAKIKAYEKLNGELPQGFQAESYRLTMRVKEK